MKSAPVFLFIFITLTFFSLTACNTEMLHASAPIRIKDPWLRWYPETNTAELYFYIVNKSDADETLLEVSSEVAANVEFYNAPAGEGFTDVENVQTIDLPVETGFIFLPDGPHLKLTGIEGGLTPGQLVPITLKFKHAGEHSFYVEAR